MNIEVGKTYKFELKENWGSKVTSFIPGSDLSVYVLPQSIYPLYRKLCQDHKLFHDGRKGIYNIECNAKFSTRKILDPSFNKDYDWPAILFTARVTTLSTNFNYIFVDEKTLKVLK